MINKNEKKKSTLIRDAIALFLITLVSGLALSYVYEITKAPIEQQQIVKKQKANQAVFTDATSFTEDEELMGIAQSTDLATINADYAGVTIDEISKAFNSNNEAIGYDITVTTTTGYKDPITIVIGYSKEKVIKGVEITSINETAGLGMKAAEPDFIGQFLDKSVSQYVVTKTGATTDDQIDAISGATITSRAVTNAINAGIGFVTEYATDLGGGKNE
ncbi:MAG: FMN-binding protein [Herbinix sp.]|nr:FMN-binding protein [Herbinix sp.]